MFETQAKKTELIIVCDDTTIKYGKYLLQLVGKKDDEISEETETIVGTKDNTVSATIYTEKQYKDTLAKITSNTHILFIGKNKTTKEEAKFVDFKIDRFGMKFGWQGKRAVMFVNEEVKKEDYEEFLEHTKEYQIEYQKEGDTIKDIAATVASWLLVPGIAPAIYEKIKAKEEMKEQQYRYLTLAIYLDELQTFLEG